MDVDNVKLYELDRAHLVQFTTTVHNMLTKLRETRVWVAVERDELEALWNVTKDGQTDGVFAHGSADRTAALGKHMRQQRAWLACENGAAADAARLEHRDKIRELRAWHRGQTNEISGLRGSVVRETADESDGVAPRHRNRTKGARLEYVDQLHQATDGLDRRMGFVLSVAAEKRTNAWQEADKRHEARVKDTLRGYDAAVNRTVGQYNEEITDLKTREMDRCKKTWAPVQWLKNERQAAVDENREAETLALNMRQENERLRASLRDGEETERVLQSETEGTDGGSQRRAIEQAIRRQRTYKKLLKIELSKNEVILWENAELRRTYEKCRDRRNEELLHRWRSAVDAAGVCDATKMVRPAGYAKTNVRRRR